MVTYCTKHNLTVPALPDELFECVGEEKMETEREEKKVVQESNELPVFRTEAEKEKALAAIEAPLNELQDEKSILFARFKRLCAEDTKKRQVEQEVEAEKEKASAENKKVEANLSTEATNADVEEGSYMRETGFMQGSAGNARYQSRMQQSSVKTLMNVQKPLQSTSYTPSVSEVSSTKRVSRFQPSIDHPKNSAYSASTDYYASSYPNPAPQSDYDSGYARDYPTYRTAAASEYRGSSDYRTPEYDYRVTAPSYEYSSNDYRDNDYRDNDYRTDYRADYSYADYRSPPRDYAEDYSQYAINDYRDSSYNRGNKYQSASDFGYAKTSRIDSTNSFSQAQGSAQNFVGPPRAKKSRFSQPENSKFGSATPSLNLTGNITSSGANVSHNLGPSPPLKSIAPNRSRDADGPNQSFKSNLPYASNSMPPPPLKASSILRSPNPFPPRFNK